MTHTDLTWREKVAILDTSARLGATMFLAILAFSKVFLVVMR